MQQLISAALGVLLGALVGRLVGQYQQRKLDRWGRKLENWSR